MLLPLKPSIAKNIFSLILVQYNAFRCQTRFGWSQCMCRSKCENQSSRWYYTALQIIERWALKLYLAAIWIKGHADLRSSIQSRNMSGSFLPPQLWAHDRLDGSVSLCILFWGLEVWKCPDIWMETFITLYTINPAFAIAI